MRKTKIKPKFHMSFAKLNALGDTCISLIERDNIVLETYGVNAATKASIEAKIEESRNFPTDEEFLGDAMNATEERDAATNLVRVAISEIMVRAACRYGVGSATYRKFGAKGVSSLKDNKLKNCAELVTGQATKCLSEMTAQGLTQQMIDNLSALNLDFDTKIIAKDQAVRARDEATEMRITLGNELYDMIIEVFSYGKSYWSTRDYAKYKSYLIYKKKKSKKNKDDQDDPGEPE